jgi:hypothetical protein
LFLDLVKIGREAWTTPAVQIEQRCPGHGRKLPEALADCKPGLVLGRIQELKLSRLLSPLPLSIDLDVGGVSELLRFVDTFGGQIHEE